MIVENKRKAYETDLTDSQWEIIEPLMWKSGNKSKWEKRELINAVLYIVDSGCKWRQLPHDFPPHTTVSNFYYKAVREGLWEKILKVTVIKTRTEAGKSSEPSYALIDSQSDIVWTDITVAQILKNEAYIGNMVQNKQGRISYKNKKNIAKPPEEHIRVEGTHEPIIDMETWKSVRKMDSKKKFRSGKDRQPSMFSGLLKCADCGMSMKISQDTRHKADGRERHLHGYICRTYSNGGKSACTSHRIRESILIEIVRQNLAQYIQKLKYSESELRKELMSRKDNNDIKSVKQQLAYSYKRISELDKLIENLYIDKVNGTIPQSAFDRLIQKYEAEHKELEEKVAALKIMVEDTAKAKDDVDRWIEIMKDYIKSGEIDRPLLISLIDTITVGEVHEENGEKVRDIKIKYNFVGEI